MNSLCNPLFSKTGFAGYRYMYIEWCHFPKVSHDFISDLTILLEQVAGENLSVMKTGEMFGYGFNQRLVECRRLKVSGKQSSRMHPSPFVCAPFTGMDDNAAMDVCLEKHIHKFGSFSIGILIFRHDDGIVWQVPGSFQPAFE